MSNLSTNLEDLAGRINTLSPYFEFSDSMVRWDLENQRTKTITRLMKDLNQDEHKKLVTHLNTRGKLNYDRYFSKA